MTLTNNVATPSLGLGKLGTSIVQTLGRQFLAILFGLGTSVIIARILGPSGNGQYAVAILLPTFLTTFLNLGIGSANVYYVGRRSVSPWVAVRASVHIWIALTFVGAIVGTIAIRAYGEQLFPGVPSLLLWVSLLAFPLGLLQSYLSSLLQGVQDFRRFNLATLASPAVLFVLVCVAFLVGRNIAVVVLAFVIARAVDLIVTCALLRQVMAEKTEPSSDAEGYARRVIQYGYKAHLSNILAFVNYKADIFLVNLLISPTAAGVYVIAVAMSEKLWVLSQAVSTVLLPRLSELHTEEEVRNQLTPFIVRWVLIITVLAAGLLAFVSIFLISGLYGGAYIDATEPLLMLLPGIVAGSVSRILANDIAARGRPELNMYTAAVVVIVNIVGNLFLIPYMGLLGAALATTLAYSLNLVFRLWIYSYVSGNRWYIHFVFDSHDVQVIQRGRHLLFQAKT